jgi:hypothetical protein
MPMNGGGEREPEAIFPVAKAGLPLYVTSSLYRLPFRNSVYRHLNATNSASVSDPES